MTAANEREESTALRRARILDAARRVFARAGGLSAGLRPIAAEAGFTTGAIYAVFSCKEEIYAALLTESLDELARQVAAAAGREAGAGEALTAAARAFYAYYAARPFEYSLGLYLFERDGRRGLGPARDAALNSRLAETLAVLTACCRRLEAERGPGAVGPAAAATALFTALIGVLSLYHSRRDASLSTSAGRVLDDLLRIFLAPHVDNSVI